MQEQEIDLGDHKLYLFDSWLSGVKSRQGGVGVAVKKSLINSIVEQVALSERICYVKFAARRRANLAVVVCYAPTNEASLQEKDLFWSQLSDLVSSFKHRERICVIGDLNAEPGHQLNDTMSCRGPFGMGEENENSEKLLSFCTSHKLLVGGTWFQHRQVHRYTYNPPDPSCRKKMLDHILFAERYRGCLTNVRTRRGKTTITDHELVIAEVSMKLLSKKPCFTPRISSAKRIKWYGHIQRMEPGRLARIAFDWDPPDQYVHARRAPGGQRKTWMSQIEGDCVRNKVSFTRLQEKATTGSKNAFNNFVVQHFTE